MRLPCNSDVNALRLGLVAVGFVLAGCNSVEFNPDAGVPSGRAGNAASPADIALWKAAFRPNEGTREPTLRAAEAAAVRELFPILTRNPTAATAQLMSDFAAQRSPAMNVLLGSLQLWQGNASTAVDYLTVAVESEPGYARAHRNLALALYHGDRPVEAVDAALTAIRLGYPGGELHALLGRAYLSQRENALAEASFRAAMKREPDRKAFQLGLVEALQRQAKFELAREELAALGVSFRPAGWAPRGGAFRWPTVDEGLPPTPLRVVASVQPQVKPAYSHNDWKVAVTAVVSEEGEIEAIENVLVAGYAPVLEVLEAFRHWQFQPAVLEGCRVRSRITQPFVYTAVHDHAPLPQPQLHLPPVPGIGN